MATRQQAVAEVDRHVEPKACFVTTDNGRDWRPLTGTGWPITSRTALGSGAGPLALTPAWMGTSCGCPGWWRA